MNLTQLKNEIVGECKSMIVQCPIDKLKLVQMLVDIKTKTNTSFHKNELTVIIPGILNVNDTKLVKAYSRTLKLWEYVPSDSYTILE